LERFWTAFFASSVAGFVTTLGILTIRRYSDWGKRNATYFASFAAGVLLSVSFLHLIPESFAMAPRAPVGLLAGYAGMHLVSRFVAAYVCDRPSTADYAIGIVPMVGIGFHSFVDGVVHSVTFQVSIFTGVATAVGMLLHEFPEGMVTYTLLHRGGMSAGRSAWISFFAAALTTPLGMLLSYPAIGVLDENLLGLMLAVCAGTLVYVGATHLVPHTEHEPRRFSLLVMASGVLAALGILFARP
jgi:ZIP family zinc transporter